MKPHSQLSPAYRRRIERGEKLGKSRSAARGHPTAADLPKIGLRDRGSSVEKALARIKRGESQRAAARAEGIGVERLRAYQKLTTSSVRQGRKWVVFDLRPETFWLASEGRIIKVTLATDDGHDVGAYWNAVGKFLATRSLSPLAEFEGRGVRDLQGRVHPFETRPNALLRLYASEEMGFTEIYADTVGVA